MHNLFILYVPIVNEEGRPNRLGWLNTGWPKKLCHTFSYAL